MINFVHEKLKVWVDWLEKRSSSGLGYPPECIYTKLVHVRSEGKVFTPDMNTDGQLMEDCVCALRATEPNLAAVITLHYIYQTMSWVQIGKHVGCSDKTAKAWVGIAQQRLLGFMNDQAAGIALPKLELKKIA